MDDMQGDEIAKRVRLVFGDVAEQVLRVEQRRMGIVPGSALTQEQVNELAQRLRELSQKIAGDELAHRVYEAVKGQGPSAPR